MSGVSGATSGHPTVEVQATPRPTIPQTVPVTVSTVVRGRGDGGACGHPSVSHG
jgi:hypothetical protein